MKRRTSLLVPALALALVVGQHLLAVWLAHRDAVSVVLATGLWGHLTDAGALALLMSLRLAAILLVPGVVVAWAISRVAPASQAPRAPWTPAAH
jgi:uncharacterized membrane protein YcfT